MSDWGITLEPIQPQPITKDFISAFYRNKKDTVYLRALDDRKKDGEEKYPKNLEIQCSLFDRIIPTLKRYNENKMGIHFIVNGGGHNKEGVKASRRCQAQFMEIDDFKMESQIKMINAFPLKPSIIVKTRKSLHTYWLLDNGDINKFRDIQKKFISLFMSDYHIQDESRPMRLPGFYHNKEEPIMVEVIHFEPDLRYSQSEIIEAINNTSFEELVNSTNMDDSEKNRIIALYKKGSKKKKSIINSSSNNDSDDITSGNRTSSLISIISKMKYEGFNNIAIRGAVENINKEQCKPPLSDFELETTVFPTLNRWDARTAPEMVIIDSNILDKLRAIHPENNKAYKWNDKGNGALFAEIFKDCLRWNVTVKQWYFYDGKIWSIDDDGMIAQKCAKQLTDALLIYSTEIEDEEIKQNYIKYISRLGQLKFRKTMIEDAKAEHYISNKMLDKDIYMLNLQNGVYDLKNFVLLDHNPEMLLSKICNAYYNPDAKAERWLQFINEVMQGNQDKINYIQKVLGYSLTGDTREETCYILYGQSTRNGKSTMVETIGFMLGEDSGYALNMRPETLAVKKNNDSRQANGDIARLKGCRFLNASEPPKRMIFDVGLVKTMLGRDQITARSVFEKEIQFIPCFKLFINTNFLPLITDDTLFSSGRINVITFDRHFTESEQDKGLKDELRESDSLSGILNWCIEGLKKYYSEGAEAPECVKDATNDYRVLSDKIGNFIKECLIERSDCNISASSAYEVYYHWCKSNGYGQENKGNFFAEMRSKGLMASSGTVNGRSVRNVIKGYIINSDCCGFRSLNSNTDNSKDYPDEMPFN